MRYASVFSGVEAASVAWAPLGWEPVCFAEVDPHPVARQARREVPGRAALQGDGQLDGGARDEVDRREDGLRGGA